MNKVMGNAKSPLPLLETTRVRTRQRTAAVQNAPRFRGQRRARQRLGVRRSSLSFTHRFRHGRIASRLR